MNVFASAIVRCTGLPALLLPFILLISGCQKAPKIDFATVPVTAMDVRLENATAIGPGQKKNLVVTLNSTDGIPRRTNSEKKYRVPWSELQLSSSVVDVNNKGLVSLVRDPRQIHGDFGHVVVTMPSHPELHAEADIPLRFDLHYREDHSGSKGFDGTNGTNGTDGMRGGDGIIDAQGHQGSGSNGSDGGDATDGSDGGRGGDADNVDIYLTLDPGTQRLIEASVSASGRRPSYYLIDPQGGMLSVSADAGQGGSGGKGGHGGRGGDGGSGTPSGSKGHDGRDGRNGSDGMRGLGGRITVIYDPAVEPYLKILRLSSSFGPSPVYISRPLQPLW